MLQRKSSVAAHALLAALALLAGCERPTHDTRKLVAIKAEAHVLMTANGIDAEAMKGRWPPAIARLEPEFVSVDRDGVFMTTRPSLDGGWGYFVPRRVGNIPEPIEKFEEVGEGVYWWHPY